MLPTTKKSNGARWLRICRTWLGLCALLPLRAHATFCGEGVTGQLEAVGCELSTPGGTFNTGTQSGANAFEAFEGGALVGTAPVTLITGGTAAAGALASGDGSRIILLGGTVQTTGAGSAGLVALNGTALIQASGVTVTTTGTASDGALAQGGASVQLANASVSTTGSASPGLAVDGAGSSLVATATNVTTHGDGAAAALVSNGGSWQQTGGTLTANGAGAAALSVVGGTGTSSARLSGVTLQSAAAPSLLIDGGTADVTLSAGSSATANNGTWLATGSMGSATVANVVVDQSTVSGAVTTSSGSTSNLTLQNGATWNLSADSSVTALTLNGSTIAFAPPDAFHTLSVATLTGQGGVIALNTMLAGDGAPSDRVVIGTSATGSTGLRITNAGGSGALTTGNGILVVNATGNAVTGAQAFSLTAPVVAGPYQYTLDRGSVDASAPQSWFLRSSVDCSSGTAPSSLCPTPPTPPAPPGPPTPPLPDYRPEVSLYTAVAPAALMYGRTLIDSLDERVGDETLLDSPAGATSRNGASAAWGRVIGLHGVRDGASNGIYGDGPTYDYDFEGVQLGVDLLRHDDAAGQRDLAGLYGAIGYATAEVTNFDNTTAGTDRFTGYSLGGYWTHFWPTHAFVDGVLQVTWYDVHADAAQGFPSLTTSGPGIGASLEGGYPFAVATHWTVQPEAQLVYQSIDLHDGGDNAASVQFNDVESLAGRLGVRLSHSWSDGSTLHPLNVVAWARFSAWYEFLGDPQTAFSSAAGYVPFHGDLGGGWGELKVGVTGEVRRNMFLYASVGYERGWNGSRHAVDGRLGVRIDW